MARPLSRTTCRSETSNRERTDREARQTGHPQAHGLPCRVMLIAEADEASKSGGFGFLRRFFFKRGNMQPSHDYTALVIEPDHDLAAARVDIRMVSSGDSVAISAARNNEERRERTCLQKLTNVRNH
jgi:hypothetical protein